MLADSLKHALSPNYHVRYPRMPGESNPSLEVWGQKISSELSKISACSCLPRYEAWRSTQEHAYEVSVYRHRMFITDRPEKFRAGQFYVVENVPARVDVESGEQVFSPSTVESLQEVILQDAEP